MSVKFLSTTWKRERRTIQISHDEAERVIWGGHKNDTFDICRRGETQNKHTKKSGSEKHFFTNRHKKNCVLAFFRSLSFDF